MANKEVNLKWSRAYKIDELDKAFTKVDELKGKGGLYLWIEGNTRPRVSYIGEAENFESRFREHIENVIHGRYTAVPFHCEDDDLLNSYYELLTNENCEYYHPQIINFSEDLDSKITIIKKGIDLKIKHLKNTCFLFAEISKENADKRKEIEAIFMQAMHKKYFEEIYKYHQNTKLKDLHWKCFSKSNTNFWGTISSYPKHDYVITNDFSGINSDLHKNELEKVFSETRSWDKNKRWPIK